MIGSLLALALALVVWSAPAHAHSDLVASTPRDGDTVSIGIDTLVLVFGEELVPGSAQVVVRDVDGVDGVDSAALADTATGGVTGSTLAVPLALRNPGRHVVTYRVVASDGHAVVGELSFNASGEISQTTSGRGSAASASGGPSSSAAPVVLPSATREVALVPPVWWALATSSVLGAVVLVRRALRRPPRRTGTHREGPG